MACGSACCGPPKSPPVEQKEQNELELELPGQQNEPKQDSCCGEDTIDNDKKSTATTYEPGMIGTTKNMAVEDGCCQPPTKAAVGCKDACCSGSNDNPDGLTTTGKDCCAPKSTEKNGKEPSCADTDTTVGEIEPSCCKGKALPCCDVSCIDRVALRECENEKGPPSINEGEASGSGASSCHRGNNGKPCNRHSRRARERYGATLEALGCLCRALLALGQESCCPPKPLSSIERRCSKKSSYSARSSVDSCCAATTGVSIGQSSVKKRAGSKKGCCGGASSKPKGDCSKGCCSKPKSPSIATAKECCSEAPPTKSKDGCAKGCCSKPKAPAVVVVDTCFSQPKKGCCDTPAKPKKDACAKGCCGKPKAPSIKSVSTIAGSCADACCDEEKPNTKGCCDAQPKPKQSTCAKGCCGDAKVEIIEKAASEPGSCADSCCGDTKVAIVEKAGSCADSCCDGDEPTGPIEKSDAITANVSLVADPEKGLKGMEHITLSISGMTCTGCETKLKRTLANVASVKNLKTSLVLARAEFDLDIAAGSLEEVTKHLERTTEFKCEKVTNQGSSFDVLTPGESAEFLGRPWPDAVTEMKAIDKKTVHVVFDAKVTGARDLLEKGWGSTPIALAPPRADPTLEAGSKHVRHLGYMTLLSATLTIPVLIMAWAPLPERKIAYASASLALATLVQVIIAGPFYPKALKSLVFSRVIEMDLLIVLSTSAAYIFSVVSFGYLVSGKPLSTGEFFETSTLLVTLIMVGRYVAAMARQKAVESISIRSLQTPTAVLVGEGEVEREIDVRLLQYGDIFKVAPETRIPTDGTVISGSSEIDESMITGESRPVEKYVRSAVIAGSINGSGTLVLRLTRLPGDNTISTIARMVDEAKLSKPKIQDIADRVASYFVPVVVVLTIITLVIWIAIGVAVRNQSGSEATIEALTYAITVLIVSCPCAIGLAVPMVIVIASGVAAERGVIFKSADSIEVAYKTSHVVLDKTGTLTQGKLGVVREEYIGSDSSSTKSLLLGLVGGIKHPVSVAIANHLKEQGVTAAAVSDAKTLTGKGVQGTSSSSVSGVADLRAGNSHWLGFSSDPRVQSVLAQGYTAFCFAVDSSLAAVFALEDSIRPDALLTVTALQKRGISVHVISGDDDGAVRSVATELGIPEENVRSRCTPGEKLEYIKSLLATTTNNKKPPVVMFCGDGTNDAAALAQATIGVHMNEGTDVAQSAADVVLMRPYLAGLVTAVVVSEKSIGRIRFNFGWSFVYNLFAVLLGAGAFVNARIPPEFAGLGELVSVLPVIAAAVMLRWSKI